MASRRTIICFGWSRSVAGPSHGEDEDEYFRDGGQRSVRVARQSPKPTRQPEAPGQDHDGTDEEPGHAQLTESKND
jgi:hypothetical protein